MTSPQPGITRRFALASLPAFFVTGSRGRNNERRLEEFGTNVGCGDMDADMDAFAGASVWLQKNGGGTLILKRGTTYLAGRQRLNGTSTGPYSWIPDPVIRCDGATSPVVVRGNGATIRAVVGLRYGAFDPVTGEKLAIIGPNFGSYTQRAVPYEGMIELTNCRGGFTITDIELHGSNETAVLGGDFGDSGRQIPASGLHLIDNTGPVRIENVYSHHHCWDGMLLRQLTTGPAAVGAFEDIRIIDYRAAYNGRQGLSLTGGRNILLLRCHFATTGKGAIRTAPAAGLDIEPEGGQIVRKLHCRQCVFDDNAGVGLLADQGDAHELSFAHCTFIGTTNFSAWPNRPGMTFTNCNFVGSIIAVFGGPGNERDAAKFLNCLFTDDRSRSPSGKVFGSDGKGSAFLIDLGYGNVGASFEACRIRAIHEARMISARGPSTKFTDCELSEHTRLGSWPAGTFFGRSSIASLGAHLGDVRLAPGATVYVNGKKVLTDARGAIVFS